MKRVLKTTIPPVQTYPGMTNLFSILWNDPERVMPWMCDHYIQIAMSSRDRLLNFIEFLKGTHPGYANTPYTLPIVVDWNVVNYKDFMDFLVEAIDNNYYIKITLDRFYFSVCKEYLTTHYPHQLFIYGYDTECSLVYCADFYNGKRYSNILIPIKDIQNSFRHSQEEINIDLHLLKLCSKEERPFYVTDIKLMNALLEDYLESRNVVYHYEYNSLQHGNEICFGLNCYEYIFLGTKNYLDIRTFHLLYENKVLMSWRLKYLCSNVSSAFNCLINECDRLASELLIAQNMVLKWQMRPTDSLYNKIYRKIKEIQKADEVFVAQMIKLLS